MARIGQSSRTKQGLLLIVEAPTIARMYVTQTLPELVEGGIFERETLLDVNILNY
jgi:hypothetical protein